MSSEFAALERLVTEAVDSHFGEPVRWVPKKQGRYFGRSADADRAEAALIGVVDFNPVTVVVQDKGKYDGGRPAVAADRVHVSFDDAQFANGYPREGDTLVLLGAGRKDEALRVSRTDPDGLGRLVCVCARAVAETEPEP